MGVSASSEGIRNAKRGRWMLGTRRVTHSGLSDRVCAIPMPTAADQRAAAAALLAVCGCNPLFTPLQRTFVWFHFFFGVNRHTSSCDRKAGQSSSRLSSRAARSASNSQRGSCMVMIDDGSGGVCPVCLGAGRLWHGRQQRFFGRRLISGTVAERRAAARRNGRRRGTRDEVESGYHDYERQTQQDGGNMQKHTGAVARSASAQMRERQQAKVWSFLQENRCRGFWESLIDVLTRPKYRDG